MAFIHVPVSVVFIWISDSSPNHGVVRQLLDKPNHNAHSLPNLRVFSFRGVSAYLESLLAQTSTVPFISGRSEAF
jgi:hypothetical protein